MDEPGHEPVSQLELGRPAPIAARDPGLSIAGVDSVVIGAVHQDAIVGDDAARGQFVQLGEGALVHHDDISSICRS